MAQNKLQHALALSKVGFNIFPLQEGKKTPIFKGGFKNATSDTTEVTRLWGQNPNANIGIATGQVSGLVVIDVDVKNGVDGHGNFQQFCEQKQFNCPLDNGLVARTPSGGYHIYLPMPENLQIKSRTAAIDGVDIRADGGYVVGPGSEINGQPYTWVSYKEPIEGSDKLYQWLQNPHVNKGVQRTESGQVEPGSRNEKLHLQASELAHKGMDEPTILELVLNMNEEFCTPPLDDAEVRQIVKNVMNRDKDYCLSEAGNGERLADRHRHELRYVLGQGAWLRYNGHYWESLDEVLVEGMAKATLRDSIADAMRNCKEEDAFNNVERFFLRSESLLGIKGMMKLARSEPGIAVSANQLNQAKHLLQVQNGVINLRTAEFLPSAPHYLHTQVAGTAYDPAADCPLWKKTISQMFLGDEELLTYFQMLCGYSLTGETSEQAVFLYHGTGANGKSVALNVILGIMGSYAMPSPPELILERKRTGNEPSSDLARLLGIRCTLISELPDNRCIDEAQLKNMTGGDQLTARHLYQNTFTFTPQFTILVACNHMPTVKNNDTAIWRRLHKVPFDYTVPKGQRDPELSDKLKLEYPGILNWMIEGAAKWYALRKLPTPSKVMQAIEDYREEMDIMGQFLAERCVVGATYSISFSAFKVDFDLWSQENLNVVYPGKRLAKMLTEHGMLREKHPEVYYRGFTSRLMMTDIERKEMHWRNKLLEELDAVTVQQVQELYGIELNLDVINNTPVKTLQKMIDDCNQHSISGEPIELNQ